MRAERTHTEIDIMKIIVIEGTLRQIDLEGNFPRINKIPQHQIKL